METVGAGSVNPTFGGWGLLLVAVAACLSRSAGRWTGRFDLLAGQQVSARRNSRRLSDALGLGSTCVRV